MEQLVVYGVAAVLALTGWYFIRQAWKDFEEN